MIFRIVLTSGATPERSFWMQRRLKTWIRSTMAQKRYNSLAILNTHTHYQSWSTIVDWGGWKLCKQSGDATRSELSLKMTSSGWAKFLRKFWPLHYKLQAVAHVYFLYWKILIILLLFTTWCPIISVSQSLKINLNKLDFKKLQYHVN